MSNTTKPDKTTLAQELEILKRIKISYTQPQSKKKPCG